MLTRRQRTVKMHSYSARYLITGKMEPSAAVKSVFSVSWSCWPFWSCFFCRRLVKGPSLLSTVCWGNSLICIETSWDTTLVSRLRFEQLKVLVRRSQPRRFLWCDNFYQPNQACWALHFTQSLGLLLVFVSLPQAAKISIAWDGQWGWSRHNGR